MYILLKNFIEKPRINLFHGFLIVCVAYFSQITLQSFNDDDIIQAQTISRDALTFLAQGRWGYYIVYSFILEENPAGPFAMLVGLSLIFFSMIIISDVIQINKEFDRILFCVMGSVSLFYSGFFSFDSTRIAYPLAILFVAIGLKLSIGRLWFLSIVFFVISFSIFQATIQIIAVVSLAMLIRAKLNFIIIDQRKIFVLILLTILSALLYAFTMRASFWVTGIPLSARVGVDLFASIRNTQLIYEYFIGYSMPNGHQMPYFTKFMSFVLYFLGALFIISVFLRKLNYNLYITIILYTLFIICAPFSLVFVVSNSADFNPRALIAFGVLHAIIAVTALEGYRIIKIYSLQLLTFLFVIFYIISSSIQINKSAFDDYLTSRNDILATNRIIYRIEGVILGHPDFRVGGPIPIVVTSSFIYSSAPRGPGSTFRFAPWSREWIFRHIDPRFQPILGERRDRIISAIETASAWPAVDSVFIHDGVVVVRIN